MLLKALFESADLPADFVTKAETLFEAAVSEKVGESLAKLQESFDHKLEESKAAFIAEAVETLDKAVEEIVLEWAKENAVAIDTQLKGQLAEGFLGGLKTLFEKADIELSGDTAGKEIAKLTEQINGLTAKVSDSEKALSESKQVLVDIKIKEIIASITEGLADTVAHRIAKLCEAFDFKSEDDFKSKATMVLEAVTGKGIKGTYNTDGTTVVVDSTKDNAAKLPTDSGENPAPELVTTVNTKPELDKTTGADGLKEQYDFLKNAHSPHHGEDLVALTLKELLK